MINSPRIKRVFYIKHTRLHFIALCFYIIAQGYTIPLLAIGPSWATFPTLPDIAFVVFLFTGLFSSDYLPIISRPCLPILKILLIMLAMSIFSYVCFVLMFPSLNYFTYHSVRDISWGLFQLYRLTQFILIFWLTAKIPFTRKRIKILERIVFIVLLFVIIVMLVPYLLNLPMRHFIMHLPSDVDIIGPYYYYITAVGKAYGTIGFYHGYVGLQVIILLGLMLNMSNNNRNIRNAFMIFISIIAVYASESRACLIAIIIYVIAISIKKVEYVFLLSIILITALICFTMVDDNNIFKGSTFERQRTILEPYKSANLSGRVDIWIDRVNFLNEMPLRWIFGSGFGSVAKLGNNAHMLVLQIIMETGVIGLIVYYLLMKSIIIMLYKYEEGIKPTMWITIVFLLTSITQITFYPAPAYVHLLGFYLCSVAIALRRPLKSKQERIGRICC